MAGQFAVMTEGCNDRRDGKELDRLPVVINDITQPGVDDPGSDVVKASGGLGDVSALFPGRPDEKRQPICEPFGRRLFFVHNE